MKTTLTTILLVGLVATGCAMPTASRGESIMEKRMRSIPVAEFDFRQASVLDALLYLSVLGKFSRNTVALDYSPVEAELQKPPGTRSASATVTVVLEDTTLHEALSVLCTVSDLRWRVDSHKIIVEPEKQKDEQAESTVPSKAAPSASSDVR